MLQRSTTALATCVATQLRGLCTSSGALFPSRDWPAGRHLMQTHRAYPDDQQLNLGTIMPYYPNLHPGTKIPTELNPPEPTWEVLHTKHQIIGGTSDATEIAEYDRVRSKQMFGSSAGLTDNNM